MQYGSDQVAFFLLDGYDVLGQTTTLDETVTAADEDGTVLGASWHRQLATQVKSGSISQNGFFDDATNAIHEALKDTTGAHRVLCWGVEGNEAGKDFTGWAGAVQVNYAKQLSVRQVHKATASYQSSGEIDFGVILHPLSAEDADGDTEASAHDGGAQSVAGGVGYLQVTSLALDGHDGVDVTILDSDDDVTYTELVAFTLVDDAPSAQRVAVAGTVGRYLAVAWEFTGTGSDPEIVFMAGFARN